MDPAEIALARIWERDNVIDWAGKFGDEYLERNLYAPSPLAMFADIFGSLDIGSVMEFGAGTGRNLEALRSIFPDAALWGLEINQNAVDRASMHIVCGSILDTPILSKYDLTLTSGLLIHIPPDDLSWAYNTLYRASNQYICLIEYYNPTPVEVEYRGGVLWKRDFAGEMMDKYDLKLVDYGFVYHRDTFPENDVTWFLMEKE